LRDWGTGYNHRAEGNSPVLEGGMGVHIHLTSWLRINQEIPCGKGMAHPNFSRCISVIKQAFNMSFEFAFHKKLLPLRPN
jgi:hypothetical protein